MLIGHDAPIEGAGHTHFWHGETLKCEGFILIFSVYGHRGETMDTGHRGF